MNKQLYIFIIAGIVWTFNVQGMAMDEIERLNQQIMRSNLDKLKSEVLTQAARVELLSARKRHLYEQYESTKSNNAKEAYERAKSQYQEALSSHQQAQLKYRKELRGIHQPN